MSSRSRTELPATEATILTATEELLVGRAFHELAVEDVLGKAGVSRASFYNYFGSKTDVVVSWSHGPTVACRRRWRRG